MLHGYHCTKAWSKTRAVVAKSSGESEFYGVARASCDALGPQTLMRDMGKEMLTKVHVAASAAKSICERVGLDHVRHIDANVLWVREQQARDRAPLIKTDGAVTIADLMTTHLPANQIEMHLNNMGLYYRTGRSQAAVELHLVGGVLGHRKEEAAQKQAEAMGENLTNENDETVGEKTSSADITDQTSRDDDGVHDGTGRWLQRGADGMWVREHRASRSIMFVPSDARRGPNDARSILWSIRITSGTTSSGRKSNIIDDWQAEGSSRSLNEKWIGTTTFVARTGKGKLHRFVREKAGCGRIHGEEGMSPYGDRPDKEPTEFALTSVGGECPRRRRHGVDRRSWMEQHFLHTLLLLCRHARSDVC